MTKLFETQFLDPIPEDPSPSVSKSGIMDMNQYIKFLPTGHNVSAPVLKIDIQSLLQEESQADSQQPSTNSVNRLSFTRQARTKSGTPKSCPNKIRKTLLIAVKDESGGFSSWI